MELILGYIGAVIIGLTMGLLGGGGSILTVPLLVYLLAVNPVLATAYSLFVVGITSLVGTIKNLRDGMVDVKTAVVFAIPAFIAVYMTRRYLLPALPDILFDINGFTLTKDMGIMIFFALLMLFAAVSMILGRKESAGDEVADTNYNFPLIFTEGAVVGVLTGIVGAGGGFLIIPALVLLVKLPMKRAVATSLFIIAVKSLIGFIGDVQNLVLDWNFLLSFSALSIVGIFIGIYLSKKINGKKLKTAFGYFVLLMGVFILIKELYLG